MTELLNDFLTGSVAVSYTHLRMCKSSVIILKFRRNSCTMGLVSTEGGVLRGRRNRDFLHPRQKGPVSYTHLDVYKRQRFIRPMMLVVLVLLLGKLISDAVL